MYPRVKNPFSQRSLKYDLHMQLPPRERYSIIENSAHFVLFQCFYKTFFHLPDHHLPRRRIALKKEEERLIMMGSVELNLRETELCLGLPGGDTVAPVTGNKRGFLETVDLKLNLNNEPERKEGSTTHDVVTSVSKEKSSCPKDPAKPPAK